MNKQAIADAVLAATEALNETLRQAFETGLKIDLGYDYSWPTQESSENHRPLVFAELKVEDGGVLAENVNPKYLKTPWKICQHTFGQVIAWTGDFLKADVYEECSKCHTKRVYIYPKEAE